MTADSRRNAKGRLAGQEAREAQANELPWLLFHYTDGAGAKGIVESSELWATDIAYLNDRKEFLFAFDMAVRLLGRSDWLKGIGTRFPSLRDAITGRLLRAGSGLGGQRRSTFVVSFTEKWDDLSQWRAYCTAGDGYALGFKPQVLHELARERGWRLERCHYGRSKEAVVIDEVMHTFSLYADGHWSGEDDAESAAVEDLADRLRPLATIMKDGSFQDEAEWRLVSPSWEYVSEKFDYRPGPSTLVPYVKFAIRDSGGKLPLGHVNVGPGPNADLAQSAVEMMLYQNKVYCGTELSGVPYRDW